MKTLQQLAESFYSQLQLKKRDSGKQFYCIKDEAPDHDVIQDIIREAHDDKFPDDYIYEYCAEAFEAISQYDEPMDYLSDITPDCYTHDLIQWMGSHSDRRYLVDEAIQAGCQDIDSAMTQAQYSEKEQVFLSILSSLNEIIDNQESE